MVGEVIQKESHNCITCSQVFGYVCNTFTNFGTYSERDTAKHEHTPGITGRKIQRTTERVAPAHD